jgi:hypothetical protein
MSIFMHPLTALGRRSLFLFLIGLCPALGFSANIQIKPTSNQLKLGATVAVELTYSDFFIPSIVEVRLTGEKLEWFGGNRISINQESGSIRVPFRLEIPFTYKGPLRFIARLIDANGTPLADTFSSEALSLSTDPTHAVGVICAPKQVAPAQTFTINAWYSLKKARPIDIHIDVLNQASKQWYAGAIVPMEDQQGQVSASLTLPVGAEGELLWKIYAAPRGEPFPNFLAESGISIPLGPTVIDDCTPLTSWGQSPLVKQVDNLMFKSKPAMLIKDLAAKFTIHYDLVSMESASLTLSLLNATTQEYLGGQTLEIDRHSHDAELQVTVPSHAYGPLYVIAYLSPRGGSWKNSVAEDRIYTLELQ